VVAAAWAHAAVALHGLGAPGGHNWRGREVVQRTRTGRSSGGGVVGFGARSSDEGEGGVTHWAPAARRKDSASVAACLGHRQWRGGARHAGREMHKGGSGRRRAWWALAWTMAHGMVRRTTRSALRWDLAPTTAGQWLAERYSAACYARPDYPNVMYRLWGKRQRSGTVRPGLTLTQGDEL
jgi:hypothetical protein